MREPFRVWKDVYAIGGTEISSPYDCCVYLVDAGELVLIDSGAGESYDQLIANIVALEFAPQRLKAAFVTHSHLDHVDAMSL